MRIISLCLPILLFVICAQAVAGEVVTVTRDKLHMLRLSKPGATVVIGNPALAEIRVEGPKLIFIFGRTDGETNFIVLDKRGREIANFDLIVTPEVARHVTVNRGVAAQSTLSCADRCTVIETGGTVAAPPAAAPTAGATPAAQTNAAGAAAATQTATGGS